MKNMVVMKVALVKGIYFDRGSQCVVSDPLSVSGIHSGSPQTSHPSHQNIHVGFNSVFISYCTSLF